ncbi:MAG: DUF721 domain-containing protein, partial [Bacteroidales bacterium]|nr:DUF721 domain-containing protein [Bacteroidales bacterium]
SGIISLGELVKQCIKNNNLQDGLDIDRLKNIWAEETGEHIARLTKEIVFDKGKLYVSISSSIVRSEVLLIRAELQKRINAKLGRFFVKEIIVR